MISLDTKNNILSGSLGYTKTFIEDGEEIEVTIDEVYNLSEKGLYIGWGMSKVGYGQYSFGFNNGVWSIDNENMGINSSSMIMETLEEGLKNLNKDYVNYFIEKLKKKFSPDCSSLKQGLTMIWTTAERYDNVNREKMNLSQPLKVGNIVLNDCWFQSEKFTSSKGVDFEDIYFVLDFDYKYMQFGRLNIHMRNNLTKGTMSTTVTDNLKEKTLEGLFGCLDQIEEQIKDKNIYERMSQKDIESMKYIVESWTNFKKEIFLKQQQIENQDILSVIKKYQPDSSPYRRKSIFG